MDRVTGRKSQNLCFKLLKKCLSFFQLSHSRVKLLYLLIYLLIYLLMIPRGYRIITWASWMSPMSPFCVSHYISLSKLSQGCECVVCAHTRAQAHKHIQIKPTQNRQAVWRQEAWPPVAESSLQPHQGCCFYLCAIHLGSFLLLLLLLLPRPLLLFLSF